MNQLAKSNTFFSNFGLGVSTFFEGFSFVFKNGLWYYFLFPLAISLLLVWGGFAMMDMAEEWLTDWALEMLGLAPIAEDASWWGGIWNSIVGGVKDAADWLISWTLTLVFWYVFGKVQKYIVLILLSPVLAFLSEKTEKILTGNDYAFDMERLMKDVVRGMLIAMRNMCIEFGFVLACWFITFWVPFLSPITFIFLFIVGAYFYGFSMIDYVNERRRLTVSQSVSFIRKNKGLSIANGTVYSLLLLIPFVGFVFAPIVGVVGATLAAHKLVNLGSNEFARKVTVEETEPEATSKGY